MKNKLLQTLSLMLCMLMLASMAPMIFANEGGADMYITDLKVNNLVEPLGIDTVPTFRWINNMSGYARAQSAYQVIVASSADNAAARIGDVWDSGKVESNLNYDVVYSGSALTSRTKYFFAVQVWDEKGESVWSDVSTFETGILDESEWSANWIGITDGDSVPCDITLDGANWIWFKDGAASSAAGNVFFRTKFTVDNDKEIDEVLLATTMDDYGFLFVNEAVVLAVKNVSGAWKTGKVINITPNVQKGDNIFSARVTNVSSSAGLIAKIEVRYTDGSVDTIVTDKSWKVSNSVSSTSGWERMGSDDSAWASPDQSVAYGNSPWYKNVVMPETMQVNVGAGAPMLRKSFDIAKEVAKANVYISGLGLYDLYVNGSSPDNSVLNPAHTQYEDTVHYRAYDVTNMLAEGKNALAVELGNYFYNCDYYSWMNWSLASYRDNPKLLLELHIEYADGTSEVIVTDESWKTYEYGPIFYNNIYRGESHDARRNVEGWTTAEFDDSAWKTAVLKDAPTGDLVFENMEPLRRLNTFVPEVVNKGNGTYLIKNPVMTTGWAKIRFNAPKGTEITIRYCEKMDDQGFATSPLYGCVMQLDKFICSGGDDVYEPKYSYKGFRYIQIENYPGELTSDDIECYLIANDIKSVSTFETGDSRINLLNELMVRTMLNNVQSKVTDTPVYEKNGWTGDFNFALESYNFNFDIANINQKFMIDMRDTANSKGVIGQNAPSVNVGGNNIPIWTTAFINGYYENWRVNGITTGFERNYEPMRLQMMSYISDIKANGWVWKDSGYADYHSPGQTSNAPEGAAIVGSAYVYQAALRMAEMADYIGESEDAAVYRNAAANIKAVFHTKFYDAEKGYYDTGYWNESDGTGRTKYRQTSNLIPLAFDLCPDEYKESVVQSIVNDIKEKGTHIDVGCVGVKYIFPVLSKYGYGDLVMDLMYQDSYPSWGYWINQGTTSLWEGYEDSSRSRDHYFLGTYTDWFYKNLAGVRDFTNGYETLVLRPEIHPEIGYVNYTLDTVRGKLVSAWRFTEDNKLVYDVTIPVGTTATVYVPTEEAARTLGSGSYTFTLDASLFDVDKSALEKQLANAKALFKADYTADSWSALEVAVINGESALESDSVIQYEVCALAKAIENAIGNLDVNGARAALCTLVESAKTYSAANFDSEIFESFSGIRVSAEATLADTSANEDTLVKAHDALTLATDMLAKQSRGNVALGKKVVASSTHTGAAWGIEKLTDGNLLNLSGEKVCGWTSHQETSYNHKEFVGVDLGAVYYIDKIRIMPAGAKYGEICYPFPIDFVISVSKDGETWTAVASEKDYPAPIAQMLTFEFETEAVRYIRFEGFKLRSNPNDGGKHRIQLAELEAYLDVPEKNMDIDLDGDVDLVDAMRLLNYIANDKSDASLLDVIRIMKQITK